MAKTILIFASLTAAVLLNAQGTVAFYNTRASGVTNLGTGAGVATGTTFKAALY